MKTKYTPGPWRVAKVIDSSFPKKHTVYVLIDDGRKKNVCAVSVYGRNEKSEATKTKKENGEIRAIPTIGDEECNANARLIAAAPELLEALENLLPMAEKFLRNAPSHPDNAMLEDARAAIAKAKGESS